MNNLVAGRDLDALVAEVVCVEGGRDWIPVPAFSTDIAAAWEVVTQLRAQGYSLELNLWPEGDCTVIVHRTDGGGAEINQTDVPLAICAAALKAVGHE